MFPVTDSSLNLARARDVDNLRRWPTETLPCMVVLYCFSSILRSDLCGGTARSPALSRLR